MKITKRQLKQLIKEELSATLFDEAYKMGDPEMALTTAQAMAAQEADIDPRSDLYVILFSATQGNSPKHKKVLQHPAFQEDPRVKKLGY